MGQLHMLYMRLPEISLEVNSVTGLKAQNKPINRQKKQSFKGKFSVQLSWFERWEGCPWFVFAGMRLIPASYWQYRSYLFRKYTHTRTHTQNYTHAHPSRTWLRPRRLRIGEMASFTAGWLVAPAPDRRSTDCSWGLPLLSGKRGSGYQCEG